MPTALIAQATIVDWKGLGAVLGVVLAALAVARIFGTPIAEKTVLWVLRDHIKNWDAGAEMSVLHKDKAAAYDNRARGWDITSVLAEANKDRLDACFTSIQSQGAEMRLLLKAVERCETNAETLDEIKDEIREIRKVLVANAVEIAGVKAILGERREFIRRELDK